MAKASMLRDGLPLAQQIGLDCMEVVNTMQDAGFSATTTSGTGGQVGAMAPKHSEILLIVPINPGQN